MSTTEEPDAIIPHVRDCTGAPGNRCSYREMLMKNYTFTILLSILFYSSSVIACEFTPEVELIGNNDIDNLSISTIHGDEYNIKCNGIMKNHGVVSKDIILKMSNGAEFSVNNMSRNMVIQKIKQMHTMLNTPNGLLIRPR